MVRLIELITLRLDELLNLCGVKLREIHHEVIVAEVVVFVFIYDAEQ